MTTISRSGDRDIAGDDARARVCYDSADSRSRRRAARESGSPFFDECRHVFTGRARPRRSNVASLGAVRSPPWTSAPSARFFANGRTSGRAMACQDGAD